MGSLWEPYGKGVPFFGAPGNSLETVVYKYPSNVISPFSLGNTSSKGPFSIAMLVYRSVY